jgi:hypothetical protein
MVMGMLVTLLTAFTSIERPYRHKFYITSKDSFSLLLQKGDFQMKNVESESQQRIIQIQSLTFPTLFLILQLILSSFWYD